MKTNIEVEITNIEVDDYYFSFDYKVTINGKLKEEDEYQDEHAWFDNKKGFKKLLESGHAVTEVLNRIDVEL